MVYSIAPILTVTVVKRNAISVAAEDIIKTNSGR